MTISKRHQPIWTTLTVVISLIFLGAACEGTTGTDIGNPNTDGAGLGVRIDPPPSGIVKFSDDDGTEYQLVVARINLRDIRLFLPDGSDCSVVDTTATNALVSCEVDDDDASADAVVTVAGPIVVDLLTSTTVPDLSSVQIPAVSYQRLDFRIADADPDDGVIDADDELAELSFFARATFDADSVLEIALSFNQNIRIEDAGGAMPQAGDDLILALGVAGWLDNVPVAECIENTDLEEIDGVVRIEEGVGRGLCAGVEGQIRENIRNGMRLDVDSGNE